MTTARQRPAAFVGQVLVLAALYCLLARLGLSLAHYHDNATLFWPPTGLSLAALLVFGRQLWPGVLLGALLLSWSLGSEPLVALGIGCGNTLEAYLGALVLTRLADFRPTFERVRDVVAFFFVGAMGCTLVSATFGVTSLVVLGSQPVADPGLVWLIWWLGDVGGAIAVAPLLLLARFGSPSWRVLVTQPEAWVLLACLVGVSLLPFGGLLEADWALLASFFPFAFVVWAGARLGTRGAVVAAFSVTMIAIAGSTREQGPFVVEETHTSLMLLWAYGFVMATASLMLASAISQRDQAQRRYREGEAERLEMLHRMSRRQRLEGLGLLAGGIAHDFNNILTVIRGNAALLHGDVKDERASRRLLKIQTASLRAAELCERLLAYAGRGRATKSLTDLRALSTDTVSLVRTSVPQNVQVSVAAEGDVRVEGDTTLLRQVLMNLVLNAADAIGDRSGNVHIRIGEVELGDRELLRLTHSGSATPGRFGTVEVIDDGDGMDAETRDRIFDPFFTTKPGGRGLGLASVVGIVQSHGGALDVESQPGGGSQFRVHLPLERQENVAEVVQEAAEAAAAPQSAEGLVLVADDEPEVRELVVHVLEASGYRTLAADGGRGALDLYRARSADIDALVLDISMRPLSGLDVLREVRASDTRIPVLLMSGREAPSPGWGVEPTAFLRKPFEHADLLAQIGMAIEASRTRPMRAARPAPTYGRLTS